MWNQESGSIAGERPAFVLEGDNDINGTLTLTVTDAVAGEAGILRGFTYRVYSRYD